MKTHYHRYLELSILVLILYSIAVHFVELEFTDSEQSAGFFHWSECVLAGLFTVEYLGRWVASRSLLYPLRLMAIIDLLAILPFYVGVLVDLRSLRVVRAFRILRLFKLYRYTNAMQCIGNAFSRIRYEFGIIGFAVLTLGWLGAVAVFELEHAAQPEAFAKLSDAGWFVLATITTVGYGDKVPVTIGGRLATAFVMLGGLGLFGTFVSLIGSAFVDELRKSAGAKTKSLGVRPDASIEVTEKNFDPHIVLVMLGNGVDDSHGLTHTEALRLLKVACDRLLLLTDSSEHKSL